MTTTHTQASNTLTDEQKTRAVSLFLIGEYPYTEISATLGVSYHAVNAYMMEWKRSNGILKTRKPRTKKKDRQIKPRNNVQDVYSNIITKALLEELFFLRKYYMEHTGMSSSTKDKELLKPAA